MIRITHTGQKFLSVSDELVEIKYLSNDGKGFRHYGYIGDKRYDYTTDGKAFAVLGRNNKHHNLKRELTQKTDPEYFL